MKYSKPSLARLNPFEGGLDTARPITLELAASAAMDKHLFSFDGDGDGKINTYAPEKRAVSRMHALVRPLLAGKQDLFKMRGTGECAVHIQTTKLGQALVRALATDFDMIRSEFPMYRFSPVFEVFFDFRGFINPAWLTMHATREKIERMVSQLNAKVELFRTALRAKELQREYANFRRAAAKNFRGLVKRLDIVASMEGQQLILRFDLHSRAAAGADGESPLLDKDALPSVRSNRERFHRYMCHRFGSALRMFASCLEFGMDKGWHYHYLVILDPKFEADDAALVNSLKGKWKSLTEFKGELHNCNSEKARYDFLAIGHVDMKHHKVVKGLLAIASYMTLPGLFVHLEVEDPLRTFAQSHISSLPKKRGRPARGRPAWAVFSNASLEAWFM